MSASVVRSAIWLVAGGCLVWGGACVGLDGAAWAQRLTPTSTGGPVTNGPVTNVPVTNGRQDGQADQDSLRPSFTTTSIRGKFVWLSDGMRQIYGVETDTAATTNGLALMTPEDRLILLVEDNRGKAFRVDPRLREMDLELLVRQYDGAPAVQIVRMHEIANGQKWIVDYWCDICAIPMFVDGPCDCCQEPNRLRRRPAEQRP